MKCIIVMFDSLNRHMLPPYGCTWTVMPNFQRLAERTVTFDRSYVCSMPCMPARRDFHTGRPNFLHRAWGPLEPFDDSVPQMLREAEVHTALISDHQHYWEDGGATYHDRYSTWQFHRGQEGDRWIGQVDPEPPAGNAYGRNAMLKGPHNRDRVNRKFMPREQDQPQSRTFAAGIEFIDRNHHADNWLLQIETFDPHEPFFTQRHYKDLYPEHYASYRGPLWDWPGYEPVQEEHRELVEHMRHEYAALLSMCDAKLGDVLDAMDRHGLWEDTMLVVWTDHGFLLGEHDWWAKMRMPWYNEKANTPFFVWDPRSGKRGERRQALVQPSLDLGPTLLEYFGLKPTADMTGKVLRDTIAQDTPVREAGIYGQFGMQVNVTDGRYVYMRGPATEHNGPQYEYTLMPTRMRSRMTPEFLRGRMALTGPFRFTKGCQVLRIGGRRPDEQQAEQWVHADTGRTLLFDLEADPGMLQPIEDAAVADRMVGHLVRLMTEVDAPAEQYERLGLDPPSDAVGTGSGCMETA